ncbi:MAG TPA: hypothetical protein VGH28_17575 [Polyangiaceae bacterium]
MERSFFLVVVMLACEGCGGRVVSDGQSDASSGRACIAPAAGETFDASFGQCRAQPDTINGSPMCAPGQYSVTCQGGEPPPAALDCSVVPIPTPECCLVYCCRCAP